MSRDEIIAMAREAGFDVHFPGVNGDAAQPAVFGRCTSDMLERFAALVAAAEREACAKVADATFRGKPGQSVNLAVANAIRARARLEKPCA